MIVLRRSHLPAGLLVARPNHGGEVLVVVGEDLTCAQVRDLSAILLRRGERRRLRRFLDGQ